MAPRAARPIVLNCSRRGTPAAVAIAVVVATACSPPSERPPTLDRALTTVAIGASGPTDVGAASDASDAPALDGTLAAYVGSALFGHPALRARYYQWQAAARDVAIARKLPEPTLRYGLFARSVETRVGPQNHRLSLSQTVPWPTAVLRASDAAAHRARAAERLFEAEALAVRLRVARAYWALWLTRRQRDLHRAHRDLLRELGDAIRSRVEVGRASLADASQTDLAVSRLDDRLHALDSAAHEQRIELWAALGSDEAPPGDLVTATAPARPGTPAAPRAQLVDDALEHPLVQRFEHLVSAAESARRSARARGLPSLSVGVDYIQTGDPASPAIPDAGKDAVVLSAGLSIPLWRGSYAAAEEREHSLGRAARAETDLARLDARARVEAALTRVAETRRGIEYLESTLAPQADAVYAAQVGGYATGEATLGTVLLAQEQVLELRLALARERARHEIAWSELELAVGRPLARAAKEAP